MTRRGAVESRCDVLAFLWLGLSVAWAVVVVVTDQSAWPLALWVAATLGPLAARQARSSRTRSGDAIPETTNQGADQ